MKAHPKAGNERRREAVDDAKLLTRERGVYRRA
jgi:hypothetical protein